MRAAHDRLLSSVDRAKLHTAGHSPDRRIPIILFLYALEALSELSRDVRRTRSAVTRNPLTRTAVRL